VQTRISTVTVIPTIFVVLFLSVGTSCSSNTEAIPAPPDVAAAPADAITTASGLAYKVLVEGTGESPTAIDRVTVHYTGWTTDGEMFDSSVVRGSPSTFALNQVIAGWTEGLQLMRVGGSHRLWIPDLLAYRGQAGRPQGTLVFDIELLAVLK